MSDRPISPYYDDEISISELLMKLWAKRGLIVALPLVLAGLTLVGLLVGKTSQHNTVSFYIELDGISLSSSPANSNSNSDTDTDTDTDTDSDITTRYPNGTLFSPQDLMNPSVIAAVASQYALPSAELANHIDVQFGTPLSAGVLKEYEQAIAANSKASAQELGALNQQYERKFQATSKRGLKISVNFVELGVTEASGSQIAESLAKEWNTIYRKQFVTALPAAVAGLRWTDVVYDITSNVGIQEADNQLRQLQIGAELLAQDERLRGLKNARGTTASDLAGYFEDFRDIFFEPMFLATFSDGSSLSKIYEQDLRLRETELAHQIAELDTRLADIRSYQQQDRTSSSAQSGARDATQIDGSALNTIVNLAAQASLSGYLQRTLDERYQLVQERTQLQTRLSRIAPDQGSDTLLSPDFKELAQARYGTLVTGYADLLKNAQAILDSTLPSYYSVITQPEAEGTLVDKRDLLFIALAIALGGMLAIIAALVWPQRQTS